MKRKISVWAGLALISFSSLLTILLPATALAADPVLVDNAQLVAAAAAPTANINWINAATLDVNVGAQVIRFHDGLFDPTVQFDVTNYGTCPGKIVLGTTPSGAGFGTMSATFLGAATATVCQPSRPTPLSIGATFGSAANRNIFYAQIDASTIVRVDAEPSWVFQVSPADPNRFYKVSELRSASPFTPGPCNDVIIKDAAGAFHLYVLATGGTNIDPLLADTGCAILNTKTPDGNGQITTASANISPVGSASSEAAKTAGAGGTLPGAGGPPGGGPVAPTCSNIKGGGGIAVRWFICPVIELLDSGINWLDTEIQVLLLVRDPTTATSSVPGTDTNIGGLGNATTDGQLKTAWGRIRNVALIVLIPIMLTMVIGTALDVKYLDPYTVRRAMPRFLIAIVFISISWYITGFLINLSNILGTGIAGLITQPFCGNAGGAAGATGTCASTLSDIVSRSPTGLAGPGGLPGLVIFGGLIAGGVVSFLVIGSYALVALVAILIGFLILVMRQLVIVVLIMLAPVAILSWVFPGNNKLWKTWWETFSRLLLLFPVIMILVSAGKIFAILIGTLI